MIATLRALVDAGVRSPWGASATLAAGFVGAALGAALAEWIVRMLPLPMGTLEAARAAGILSGTVLAGYPKSAELLFLCVGLATSTAFGLTAAAGVGWRIGAGAPHPGPVPTEPRPEISVSGWEWVALLVLFAVGANPAALETPGNALAILQEEGVHLAALTTLAHGGRLFEHYDYLYGPVLLLPLLPAYWLEPSVFGVRVGTLVLHGTGLVLMALLARPLFQTRAGWLLLVLLLAWLGPLPHPRLHLTAYRSALAFAPVLFLPRALAGGPGAWWGVGCGVAVATLASPELLMPAAIGPLVSLAVGAQRRRLALVGFAGGWLAGLLVGCLLFLPVADPVAWVWSATDKLRAVGLGYLARGFPVPWGASRLWAGHPFDLAIDPADYVFAGNAVVGVAVACLGVAAFQLLRGPLRVRDGLLLAFALTAALLLPKLVSRPGVHQFTKVLPGILVVAAALAERGGLRLRRDRSPAAWLPALVGIAGLALLASSATLRTDLRSAAFRVPTQDPRLGPIPVLPRTASFIGEVRGAVDRRLPPGEAVWAGPAAPGWNFLLDRSPAHPLPLAIWTTTHASRQRALERLIAAPPMLVLRQTLLANFEGVATRDYLGVVEDHLERHYRVVEVVGRGRDRVELLEPRGSAARSRARGGSGGPLD